MIRIFPLALAAAIVGFFLFPWVGGAYGHGTAMMVANAMFFLLLVACGAWPPPGIRPRMAVDVSNGMTLFLAVCAIVGALLYDAWRGLARALIAGVAIGYYPSGPDVPLVPGMGVWAVSVIALSLVGLLSGSLLRRLASQRGRRDEAGLG